MSGGGGGQRLGVAPAAGVGGGRGVALLQRVDGVHVPGGRRDVSAATSATIVRGCENSLGKIVSFRGGGRRRQVAACGQAR